MYKNITNILGSCNSGTLIGLHGLYEPETRGKVYTGVLCIPNKWNTISVCVISISLNQKAPCSGGFYILRS